MQVSICQGPRDGVGHDGQVVALKLCLLLKPILVAPEVGEVSRARGVEQSESRLHAIVHFAHQLKRLFGDRPGAGAVMFVRVDAHCTFLVRLVDLLLSGGEVEVCARDATENPECHVVARYGPHGRSQQRGRVVARV